MFRASVAKNQYAIAYLLWKNHLVKFCYSPCFGTIIENSLLKFII